MEILNIFVVVLAVLGPALAQLDPSDGPVEDYQQAVDDALATIKSSSDFAKKVADEAVAKIEDIVNSFSLAFAEARFSLVHITNFAALNNLTELAEVVPDDPAKACVTNEVASAITGVLTSTAGAMINCFTIKIAEANDIHKEILALDGEVTDILPKAAAALDKCSQANDLACVEAETRAILEGCAAVEKELGENVIRAETLLSSFHTHLEQCMGDAAVGFIADIGRSGSKMMSCFLKGY